MRNTTLQNQIIGNLIFLSKFGIPYVIPLPKYIYIYIALHGDMLDNNQVIFSESIILCII